MQATASAPGVRPSPRGEAPPRELEELFREHHQRVIRVAYRITGSLSDAEDVLQTVFLRLARRTPLSGLQPSPGSYLHRAAINAAIDVVRTRAGHAPLEAVAPSELSEPGAGNPEEAAASRQLLERLRRAIAQLRGRAAEMFVLRYLEDRTPAEIARLMSTSRGVVAVTLFRARNLVKKELQAHRPSGDRHAAS